MALPEPVQSQLRREIEGEVHTDPFTLGRYATDASIYQIVPLGVVVPRSAEDVVRTIEVAAEHEVAVIPRGAGTSQSGQSIGRGIVIDTSRHLDGLLAVDPATRRARVQPGIVLDRLNDALRPHGLFFPIDVATASRATIGGMAGNNSAGARSIKYGLTADNVHAIEGVLADGARARFGPTSSSGGDDRVRVLVDRLRDLHAREREELAQRLPAVLRRVAGYNLDRVAADAFNLASVLVGSEGTLAVFTELELTLHPRPPHAVLGVCHFPTLADAARSTQHVVALGPSAVELIDDTLLRLADANPAFRGAVSRFVRGAPGALLLVEFSGQDAAELRGHLDALVTLMGDLGFPDAVVRAEDAAFQQEIWGVRRTGMNIVMSMRGDGKPVSFIEDCAVPLEHLAEYTERLNGIFAAHGTTGTWYAHASVGCLHVRPILNLKLDEDVRKMRSIAEAALELVREFRGSFSGEHGDGLVRSEFVEPMVGPRVTRAFEEIKDAFDPAGRLNPGKIVRPPRFDDRSLFRYGPAYRAGLDDAVLDWSAWSGLGGAVEMCNNNGACRRFAPGVMCPSYRVTRDEEHTTRGRANSLRLALSGQLGPDAFTSDRMKDAMDLCVGCKGCRRECPTGVDMARMKIEFLHHYHRRHGLPRRDRLIAYLPRIAPWASRAAAVVNAAARLPGLSRATAHLSGLTVHRPPPAWARRAFRPRPPSGTGARGEVALWVDTFSTYFEPANAHAAHDVLEAAGYRVDFPCAADGSRPLCCGRTFLNAGLVDEARVEARRLLAALVPLAARGIPIVGLEPSCLLTLRDEYAALFSAGALGALPERSWLFDEFLAREFSADAPPAAFTRTPHRRALVHGHCHQKAFGIDGTVAHVLRWIPDLEVTAVAAGCCGMAGSFGYEAEHYDISMRMAELELLPAVREADDATVVVADGTSCRAQIQHGAGRAAVHAARLLADALAR